METKMISKSSWMYKLVFFTFAHKRYDFPNDPYIHMPKNTCAFYLLLFLSIILSPAIGAIALIYNLAGYTTKDGPQISEMPALHIVSYFILWLFSSMVNFLILHAVGLSDLSFYSEICFIGAIGTGYIYILAFAGLIKLATKAHKKFCRSVDYTDAISERKND